jgi:hypothetical protein
LDRFQDDLLTGDYQDKYINQDEENKYINQLKKYYAGAKKRDVITVPVKKFDDYAERTRTSNALKNLATGALAGGALVGLSAAPALTQLAKTGPPGSAIVAGLLVLGALSTGAIYAKALDKPHFTTSSGVAKKRLQLTDDELLKVLRGEAVRREELKTTDHFIKIK